MASERSLVYRISVTGQAEGVRAVQTFLETAKKLAEDEKKVVEGVAAARVGARRRGLAQETSAEREFASEQSQLVRRGVADYRKGVQEREREAVRAGDRIVKALDKEVAAFEKSEKQKTAIADREQKQRDRAAERAATRAQAIANRDARQRARDNAFEVRRLYKGVATGVGEGLYGAYRVGERVISRGVSDIAGGLGLNSALDIQGIIGERMLVNHKLRAIAREARGPGEDFTFDVGAARKSLREASKTTGISQTELVGALDVFSEKGLGAIGTQNIGRVAKEARALDTDAATVARIRAQMLISGKQAGFNLGEEDLRHNIAMMSFLGKTGVFRAKDIAKEAPQLLASFGAHGGDFGKGLEKFTAFAEVAATASGGAAQTKTSIVALQSALAKGSSIQAQHALGIKTEGRDFVDIMMDVIQKTGGEGKTFDKIMGREAARRAAAPFLTAFKSAGGGKKGTEAMHQLLAGADVKGATTAEFEKEITNALDEEETKLASAVERIRQMLEEKLEPALDGVIKMMPQLEHAVGAISNAIEKDLKGVIDFAKKNGGALGGVAEFALDHPLAAAGGYFGARAFGHVALNATNRFVAGKIASHFFPPVPARAGVLGRVAGKIGGIATAIATADATNVFIVGAAPGVFPTGGGGGGGDIPTPGFTGRGLLGAGGVAGIGGVGAAVGIGAASALWGAAIYDQLKHPSSNPMAKGDLESTGIEQNAGPATVLSRGELALQLPAALDEIAGGKGGGPDRVTLEHVMANGHLYDVPPQGGVQPGAPAGRPAAAPINFGLTPHAVEGAIPAALAGGQEQAINGLQEPVRRLSSAMLELERNIKRVGQNTSDLEKPGR